MKTILKSTDLETFEVNKIENGSWVILANPKNDEVTSVADECNIDLKDLRSALDKDELSRIENEEDYVLILIDIPVMYVKNKKTLYKTAPLAIIYTDKQIITVCLDDSPVVRRVTHQKNLCTFKKTQLLYKLLLSSAKLFLEYLVKMNSMRDALEEKVSTKETLEELYELEKCLVYFKNSLRSNDMVLSRLANLKAIQKYEEDEDLYDDMLIEYKQAYEMAQIYYDILDNTIEKYRSLMDFELNNAMKLLTSLTVVMAIPTVISGFFGMNVLNIPFANSPIGFWIIFVITLVICLLILLILMKRKML